MTGGNSPQPIDNVGKLSLSRCDKKTVRFCEPSWRRWLNTKIVCCLLFTALETQAVTFDITDSNVTNPLNTTSQTVTAGGITLTLTGNGGDGLGVDSDGIFLNGAGETLAIQFDQAVTLDTYTIGYVASLTTGTLDITGSGVSSTNNPADAIGTYVPNSAPITLLANTTYTIDPTVTNTSQISALDVSVPAVPASTPSVTPSVAPSPIRIPFAPITAFFFILLGLGAITSVWRNRKKRK